MRIVDELRLWLTKNGLADREVVSAHVWLDYVTGRRLPPDRPSVREQLRQAPLGTLFAWDKQFAASADHALHWAEFRDCPAFRQILVTRPAPFKSEPYLTLFEKTGPWDGTSVRSRKDNS